LGHRLKLYLFKTGCRIQFLVRYWRVITSKFEEKCIYICPFTAKKFTLSYEGNILTIRVNKKISPDDHFEDVRLDVFHVDRTRVSTSDQAPEIIAGQQQVALAAVHQLGKIKMPSVEH